MVMPNIAEAQYYSEAGTKNQIVIDKKISADGGKNYYDNIATSIKTFSEGNKISFKIVIENKGKEKLTNIKMTDYLPKYLSLLFYPGVYDKSNNTLGLTIGSLEAGEAKAYLVLALVKNLPSGNYSTAKISLINKACVVNQKVGDCDEARYYAVPKVVPTTGSADIVFQSLAMLSVLGAGMAIRKKVRGF